MNSQSCTARNYDDMIGFNRPVSKVHSPMARNKRAAQFAPFDALTGLSEAIAEVARETESREELSEDMINMLDAKLAVLHQHVNERPKISVTYFVPDQTKERGQYVTVSEHVKAMDNVERVIVMRDGTRIPIRDVRFIDGDLFDVFG